MIAAILEGAGITPPPKDSNYTQCPECSDTRRKSKERCLMVKADGWNLQVYCQHCGWQKKFE
jgi:RNase P subunit RPR2